MKEFDSFDVEAEPYVSDGPEGRRGGADIIGTNKDGTPKTARYPGAFTSTEKSPYEQSAMAADALEAAGRGTLFNDRQPHYVIKHQKPEHVTMIYMKASGHTNIEIAEAMEVTPVCVANVLKQPWARLQLAEIQKSAGGNEVQKMFELAKGEVAQTLIDMATGKDETVPAAVKKSACDTILDRLFGKATQPIKHDYADEDLDKMSDSELLKLASGRN